MQNAVLPSKTVDNQAMHAKPPTARVLKHGSLRRLGDRRRITGTIVKNLSISQTKWIISLSFSIFLPIYICFFFVEGSVFSLLLTLLNLINNLIMTQALTAAGVFFYINLIFYSIVLYVFSLLLSKVIFRFRDPNKRMTIIVLFVFILLILSSFPIYSVPDAEQKNIWQVYQEILLATTENVRWLFFKK